jgi:hypothetical protein
MAGETVLQSGQRYVPPGGVGLSLTLNTWALTPMLLPSPDVQVTANLPSDSSVTCEDICASAVSVLTRISLPIRAVRIEHLRLEHLRLDRKTAGISGCAADALTEVPPCHHKTAVRQRGALLIVLVSGYLPC